MYTHLVDALRHVRSALPKARIIISTSGDPVREEMEDPIVAEQLADCIAFSVDGSDAESYNRYRIGGSFEKAFSNMVRFHRKAQGTSVHIVWQYVLFRWNDSDEQVYRAIRMAKEAGLTLWFDITQSWGHTRRSAADLRYLRPHLKPFDEMIGPIGAR